jgi:hypothetical protein
MDSRPSETFPAFSHLKDSLSRGDWAAVESLSAAIRQEVLPSTPEELSAYLHDLRETLIAVKMARADLKASSARLHAAAGFRTNIASPRQNSAVSTEF